MAHKGKSNNPPLAAIECEGCDGFATIRRRANGRRLLYTHCPNCGMNQMSGEKLQAKWRKAIGEQPPELPALKSEAAPSAAALNNEWQPREVREEIERINNETKTSGANNNERTSEPKQRITSEQNSISTGNGGAANGLAFFAFGAFAGLAAIAGLRR